MYLTYSYKPHASQYGIHVDWMLIIAKCIMSQEMDVLADRHQQEAPRPELATLVGIHNLRSAMATERLCFELPVKCAFEPWSSRTTKRRP